jgi:hypothetical protein
MDRKSPQTRPKASAAECASTKTQRIVTMRGRWKERSCNHRETNDRTSRVGGFAPRSPNIVDTRCIFSKTSS